MALNGVEPVIIFKLYPYDYTKNGLTLQKWQNLTEYERDLQYPPILIPLYLGGMLGGEQLTGLALDEADQTIDFGQMSIGGLYYHKNMGQDVTITFRSRRDNPVMIALMAIIARLIALVPKQQYGVTLYYDSMFVLNGMIKSISQQTIENSNVKLVQIIISERSESGKESESGTDKEPLDKKDGDRFLPNIKKGA